jgi:hypothetical protein
MNVGLLLGTTSVPQRGQKQEGSGMSLKTWKKVTANSTKNSNMNKLNIKVDKSQLTPQTEGNLNFKLIELDRNIMRRCVNATPSYHGHSSKRKKVTSPEIADWVRMYLSGIKVPEMEEITGRDGSIINRFLCFVFGPRRGTTWVGKMHSENRLSNLMNTPLQPIDDFMTDAD